MATRLAAGDWLDLAKGPFWRPLLFAYVCALLFTVPGPDFIVVHLFVLACNILAIVAWYSLARRCFPRLQATLGTLGLCVYGPFIHFSASGYRESFAMAQNLVLLLLLVVHAERAVRRRQHPGDAPSPWGPLAGAGVLAGLSVLTCPTVLLFLPAFALALLWFHFRLCPRWSLRIMVAPTLFLLMTVVTMEPNALRHWICFRLWAPLGVASEMAFHMGNNDDGWGWHVSSPGIEFVVYRNMPMVKGGPERVSEVRQWWKEENRRYVLGKPGEFLRNLGYKVLQTWNGYEVHLTNNFQEMQRLSPAERYALKSGVVFPLGLVSLFWVGLILRRRIAGRTCGRWQELVRPGSAATFALLLLVLWTVLYMFGVALYMANTRHRLPALPPLVLMAGFGVWVLWRHLTKPHIQRLERSLSLFALTAGAAVGWLPVTPS